MPAPAPQLSPAAPPPKRPPPAIAAPAAQTGTAPAASGRMSLKHGTSGLIRGEPLRILAYGVEGVGKSTFGANAPKARVLGAEDGTAELAVDRFPQPQSWADVLEAVEVLRVEEHDYKTLVVDSLDWLEPMCWAHVCALANKPDIESFGYGKGYSAALDQWRVLHSRLSAIVSERRMNVILIAHAILKTFKNPDANQGDYDRYTLKLNDKAGGLWKEWAKVVLFCNYERATVEKDGRHRGMDTGKRVMYTRMSAAYDAKNRLGLPPSLPLSWAAFERAAKAGEDLRIQLAEAMSKVDAATRQQAQEWIESEDYKPEAIQSAIAGLVAAGAQPATK